ncbi:MAG: Gfo/Idh/MocA family oxidoreductase [Roseiflexaceae bacterium]
MSRLAWGIIGPGRISRKFAAGVRSSQYGSLLAVASRDAARAQAAAQELGAARAYAGYQQLLDDPDVQAVYIALPNSMHPEWAIRAASAGKHILCEKPLAPTAAEAARIRDAADAHGVVLVEAFMYRFHPRTQALAALIQSGAIGRVQLIRIGFSFSLDRPNDPRWDPELAGGALYDIGCYAVNLARLAVGQAPQRAFATARWSESGVDEILAGTIEYPGGAIAQIACSFRGGFQQQLQIIGSDGVIEIDQAFTMHPDQATQLRIWRGTSFAPLETLSFEPTNHYRLEADGVALAVLANQAPAMPVQETIENLATIEALLRSARSGSWQDVVS